MDDEIITLTAADGTEIEFVNVAGINLDGRFFAILQPVELLEGMGENDALVFEVVTDGENESFTIITDDEIVDRVFAEYNRLLDEQEGN